PIQRSIAAWIAWRADERLPLNSAAINDAYRAFLRLRNPPDALTSVTQLSTRAAMDLKRGRLGLAEAADSLAWETGGLKTLQSSAGTAHRSSDAMKIWSDGPGRF